MKTSLEQKIKKLEKRIEELERRPTPVNLPIQINPPTSPCDCPLCYGFNP